MELGYPSLAIAALNMTTEEALRRYNRRQLEVLTYLKQREAELIEQERTVATEGCLPLSGHE
jgi:hypothetical protein